MKKLDGIIRSGMHKVSAPISRARNLCADLDIMAQRKLLQARLNLIFRTPKIKPLLIKYLPVKKYFIRFKTAGKALIISYLSPSAADRLIFGSPKWKSSAVKMLKNLHHRLVLRLNTVRTFITSYAKGGNVNLIFRTAASASSRKAASGRMKILFSNSDASTNAEKYISDENKWSLLSGACSTKITRFLKSAASDALLFSPSVIHISYGRYRLLSDMDGFELAVFDNLALGDVDYIFFDS